MFKSQFSCQNAPVQLVSRIPLFSRPWTPLGRLGEASQDEEGQNGEHLEALMRWTWYESHWDIHGVYIYNCIYIYIITYIYNLHTLYYISMWCVTICQFMKVLSFDFQHVVPDLSPKIPFVVPLGAARRVSQVKWQSPEMCPATPLQTAVNPRGNAIISKPLNCGGVHRSLFLICLWYTVNPSEKIWNNMKVSWGEYIYWINKMDYDSIYCGFTFFQTTKQWNSSRLHRSP